MGPQCLRLSYGGPHNSFSISAWRWGTPTTHAAPRDSVKRLVRRLTGLAEVCDTFFGCLFGQTKDSLRDMPSGIWFRLPSSMLAYPLLQDVVTSIICFCVGCDVDWLVRVETPRDSIVFSLLGYQNCFLRLSVWCRIPAFIAL